MCPKLIRRALAYVGIVWVRTEEAEGWAYLILYMCWLGKQFLGFSRWPKRHPEKTQVSARSSCDDLHRLYAVQGSDASVRDDLSKGLKI
jgi:hypothetical protein